MRSEARSEEERVMLRFKDHSIPDLLTKPEIRTALQSQSMKEIPLIFFSFKTYSTFIYSCICTHTLALCEHVCK